MSDSSDDEAVNYENENLITDDEDEVMPSDDDDEDDDNDDFYNNDKFSRFKIEVKKDEMASDIEDDDENDYLPNSQAWGKNKQQYYNTDYIDKDFRGQKANEEDLANYEGEEALAIQKRLLESVSENDLGIDLLIGTNETKPKDRERKEKKSEKIEFDVRILTDVEKLNIIKRESPELELLIADFKCYSTEITSRLRPILKGLAKYNSKKLTSGMKYLKLRYSVLLSYCTNICFYLSLKSSSDKQLVKDHPIIKQLFKSKKLISELDSCSTKWDNFLKEIDFVLDKLDKEETIRFIEENDVSKNDQLVPSTNDELFKVLLPENKQQDGVEFEDDEFDDDAKRAITYEMEKNKGLISKRKKEQRNPRVKYRKKFEKAIIRRKGQVREPRKELKKYGGELTGINVRAVKSVKFK